MNERGPLRERSRCDIKKGEFTILRICIRPSIFPRPSIKRVTIASKIPHRPVISYALRRARVASRLIKTHVNRVTALRQLTLHRERRRKEEGGGIKRKIGERMFRKNCGRNKLIEPSKTLFFT